MKVMDCTVPTQLARCSFEREHHDEEVIVYGDCNFTIRFDLFNEYHDSKCWRFTKRFISQGEHVNCEESFETLEEVLELIPIEHYPVEDQIQVGPMLELNLSKVDGKKFASLQIVSLEYDHCSGTVILNRLDSQEIELTLKEEQDA